MQKYYLLLSLFSFLACASQKRNEVKKQLKSVTNLSEFDAFKKEHADWNIELIEVDSIGKDDPKTLLNFNEGDVKKISFNDKKYFYKLVLIEKIIEFKASYIYLNGSKLTDKEIDSLRPIIIRKYKSGTPFRELAQQYTMDGNLSGELDWFPENRTVTEFEKAVKENDLNAIFTVDVASRNWYYVVLKTHNNRKKEKFNFIRIEI